MAQTYADLTLETASQILSPEDEGYEVIQKLSRRISSVRSQMDRFREWCNRADRLYYAEDFTTGGADLWADDPSASTPGRSHVSVNSPPVYVDVPAALQSLEPDEDMVATDNTPEARAAAAALERVYTAWKREEEFELKFAKAATVKGLYGRTAGRVYWDPDKKRPCVEIIEQPRFLHLGYKNDAYDELEWAAYVQRYDPNAVIEEFGVDVKTKELESGMTVPVVSAPSPTEAIPARSWLNFGEARIEVWDFWYREPVFSGKGKFLRMKTMNCVVAGNMIVRGPLEYKEYQGELPYIPLFNTYLPGVPDGRADLYDMEQIIREKFEKITAGSQMIASGTAGDYWQLVGPDAPTRMPEGFKPKRNEVIFPGGGNRVETIQPFIAQFQLEQFLARLDREGSDISGLNDLLRGLAPLQALSSSKAVNALVAQYEARLLLRRAMFYQWRRRVWDLALKVWVKKDDTVAETVSAGGGYLTISDPSLNPKDEMEVAVKAANLSNAKLWSERRAMGAVGVDDPETEQDMIREEQVDATLNPDAVGKMAQLMGVLQSLGLNAPPGAAAQAGALAASGQQSLQSAGVPQGTVASQGPEQQGITPPELLQPGATPPAANQPFAQPPQQAAQPPLLQSMVAPGGGVKTRILSQAQLGRRG